MTNTTTSDYTKNVFADKSQHRQRVSEILKKIGYIPETLLESEIGWFYETLGMDDLYFMMEEPDVVANHIIGIYASTLSGICKKQKFLDINFDRMDEDSAVFIHTSVPGVSRTEGPHQENIIDEKYLDVSIPNCSYRLESYRSLGTLSKSFSSSVRAYFINKCQFVNPSPSNEEVHDITQVADKTFLAKATQVTLNQYQTLMNTAIERAGPVIKKVIDDQNEIYKILIAYRQGSTKGYFSGLSDLYHYYGLSSQRKFVEQFSNGITVISLNFVQPASIGYDEFVECINNVSREASLLYCLPSSPLQTMFQKGILSVQETVYAHVCWIFTQHFLNRLGSEYSSLDNILDKQKTESIKILDQLKKRLRQETFTTETILSIVQNKPSSIKMLYRHFVQTHCIVTSTEQLHPSKSLVKMNQLQPLSDSDVEYEINNTAANNSELLVMKSFLNFNMHVLKTNFFQSTKVALSFRLDPSFLSQTEYPEKPYGIFFVVGAEFRGFHVRFQDIARGGIRIIQSRSNEAYIANQRSLFDENYSLALTQHKKNKDIPEGGSKGTVLLNPESQSRPFVAFEKYVDSILDLLLTGQTPGVKDRIVDLYNRPEILFFGPDEGTAGFMDWASKHALHRKAHFWKAFTTGKSQAMGGIPHDKFGMTTTGVHQYVLNILKKLNLEESSVTKFQTGGPDGDLGSNEILISKDKTTSIVDGSGVLHDPEGIDREELLKLAKNRKMISSFDISKLSKKGFRVLVEDENVTLPDGTFVRNGTNFRNNYHLNPLSEAALFVPCGGRPESINFSNVSNLIDDQGKPRFKYIVEGANLFLTQDARIKLESAGVHLFKDASSNKGGVTSSSLEVLAALAFSNEEHDKLMCKQPDGTIPEFYLKYVEQVLKTIIKNANSEFDAIWKEAEHTGKPKCVITDELSKAIVSMRAHIETTSLWENKKLKEAVLSEALPELLLDKLGLEKAMERIPESYLKAIFGGKLASEFIYKYGPNPS
ncbi:hypothetical protein BB560_000392, partial [Smittium megazygosporum]